ncbi:hypothetical protein [Nocardioides sp. SR21]|uniref:hypothetical protein n=1 Tax=Nocardioides sp. SR21 TaxID=2919501 RepID=UPI001FAAF5AB|nr:hypothetical protein [Nocardioides sp. SR21]
MDTDLDDRLAASDPTRHRPTPATDAAMAQLIAETRSAARKQQRRRRTGVGAAALSVALIGGAGAAAAAGSLAGWWNDPDATTRQVTNESGVGCEVTYAPRALRDPEHPVSAKDRAAATAAAAEFLRDFDDSTLDGLTADETFVELNDRLLEALSRQGLSTHAVTVALATDCEDVL